MERPETPAAEEEGSSSFSEATDWEEGEENIVDEDAMQEDWDTWNYISKHMYQNVLIFWNSFIYLFNFDSWKQCD